MNLINRWRWMLQNGKNINAIITGPPRSGKSYAALRIAQAVSPRFTVDNIAWTIPQFVALLANPRITDGDVILFDESGVGIHNRRWYTDLNEKAINILQTYGYKHLMVLFTTPSFDFIDVQARKLFHVYMETSRIDMKSNTCYVKVRLIKYLPTTGKYYYIMPIDNRVARIKVNHIRVRKPSEELARAYDEESERWKSELIQESNRVIKQMGKDDKKRFNPKPLAKKLLGSTDKVTIDRIVERFKVTYHEARRIRAEYENLRNATPTRNNS